MFYLQYLLRKYLSNKQPKIITKKLSLNIRTGGIGLSLEWHSFDRFKILGWQTLNLADFRFSRGSLFPNPREAQELTVSEKGM